MILFFPSVEIREGSENVKSHRFNLNEKGHRSVPETCSKTEG